MYTHTEIATSIASRVDRDRLWSRHMEMAKIGATPAGGVHRLAFTPEDTEARRLLLLWASNRGFQCQIDNVANMFIRRAGTSTEAAPVVSGSHIDTQPLGGRFDGIFGILAAFEVLEALEDSGYETRRPIEAVVWSAEEGGGRFDLGRLGSQAYADPTKLANILEQRDRDNITVKAAIAEMMKGLPNLQHRELSSSIAYCVEAHIEQGPELEAQGKTIGVVTAIQGSCSFKVEVIGEAAHAGGAPEKRRKDAVAAAVSMMTCLRNAFFDPHDVLRFTIGRIEVKPNAISVVPAYVEFTLDIRHPDEAVLERVRAQVQKICQENSGPCKVTVTEIRRSKTTQFDGTVTNTILSASQLLDYSHMHIVSGGGHDVSYIAEICPAGMIFIPCWKGISHNEAESADPSDVVAGARVLAETLVALANR